MTEAPPKAWRVYRLDTLTGEVETGIRLFTEEDDAHAEAVKLFGDGGPFEYTVQPDGWQPSTTINEQDEGITDGS